MLCDTISAIAWKEQVFAQYPIHRIVYQEMRLNCDLAAQVIVRAIAKVADAYKLDKKVQRKFKPLGSIGYDDRILTYRADKQVSIWTIEGKRSIIGYVCGEHQDKVLKFRQGESDLLFYKGEFYLLACCEIPEPTQADIDSMIGVDFGIIQIAVDSLGTSFSGEPIEKVRQRYNKLRRSLQARGTKSAKRHLVRIARKESRFRKDVNHCIAKKLVQTAKDTKQGIGLEDLTHIRLRTTVRKSERAKQSGWAFAQLKDFVEYKALRAGVPTIEVDPRNTSRECSTCGHIDKRNRQSQALFLCIKCGHTENADLNAAKVISKRAIKLYRVRSLTRLQSASRSSSPATGTASPVLSFI